MDKALDIDEKIKDLNSQLAKVKTELIKNAVELSDKRKESCSLI
ncbi:MAG: hypothetical protein ACOX2A_10460 [Tepidanaerobacteraceae bacterium]